MGGWIGEQLGRLWSLGMESVEQRGRVRARAVRRGSPAPPGIQQSPTGRTRSGASCLDQGQRFPGYWRTCRGPGCVPSPESTSCHNRPESLLVTHLLPLPKACGLSCLTGDRSFPRALLCPGTCVEAAASSKMKHPFMQVSPHLAAVNHALPTTKNNYKKTTMSFTRSLILVSSESVPSSYTEQEHLTLKRRVPRHELPPATAGKKLEQEHQSLPQ